MKKVLVFGTFDRLHKGHLNFLAQARRHGDYVVAVVARDSNVRRMKKRRPIQGEAERLANLRRHADKVILGERKVTYKLIERIKPDVICIGYDQKPSIEAAKKILKKIGMEHVKLRKMKSHKPSLYKSSILNKLR